MERKRKRPELWIVTAGRGMGHDWEGGWYVGALALDYAFDGR